MKIPIETTLVVDMEEVVKNLTPTDLSRLLDATAIKLDKDFVDRANAAADFADNLSELGARFLSEIVAHRHARLR